jgi:RNA polymerase-associated protein LEO1
MSDAERDPVLSDNEVDGPATPADDEQVEAPRDTVEENGLDEDDDDLFGDGGDDDDEAA